MAVQRLLLGDKQSAERWDAFVFCEPSANFFHRSGWQTILTTIFGHECYFLFEESDGRITGVLPLAHVRSLLFGNSLVSLPFAVYGGIAATNRTTFEKLEHAAVELAARLKVDFLELRNTSHAHDEWPLQDLYCTFRKNITSNPEVNLLAVPRKQRAMIRKGIANRLHSELGKNVDIFYALYADNVRRHGTPALSRRYFELLTKVFAEDCDILIVASESGVPLSGVMNFYFRDEVLPYYAGDRFQARNYAANDFKYWELMRIASEKSYSIFDFGRSKKGTGSFSFKKNWGFEPKDLYYEYCLLKRNSIPQKNPSNKKFRILIEAWKRLPLPIANRLGPYVVSGLG